MSVYAYAFIAPEVSSHKYAFRLYVALQYILHWTLVWQKSGVCQTARRRVSELISICYNYR